MKIEVRKGSSPYVEPIFLGLAGVNKKFIFHFGSFGKNVKFIFHFASFRKMLLRTFAFSSKCSVNILGMV